jgi:hypothetical protein
MSNIEQISRQMTRASQKFFYDPTAKLEWPKEFDRNDWAMTPELISLYGTPAWDEMSEQQQKNLSFFEAAGFYSLILNGERPLLEGMSHRIYTFEKSLDVTEYMHHFMDEENKHMMMFSGYLRRYVGKVYPEKKIAFAREFAKGGEDLSFLAKVLVVEELSDYYNIMMAADERLPQITRDLNRVHHVDEARHVRFGREYIKHQWERFTPDWSEEEVAAYRNWLVEYINSSWRDFINPSVYRDAGVKDGFSARQAVIDSPVCRAHRQRASEKFLTNLVDSGILIEMPQLS